jgi:hypothetical protein
MYSIRQDAYYSIMHHAAAADSGLLSPLSALLRRPQNDPCLKSMPPHIVPGDQHLSKGHVDNDMQQVSRDRQSALPATPPESITEEDMCYQNTPYLEQGNAH